MSRWRYNIDGKPMQGGGASREVACLMRKLRRRAKKAGRPLGRFSQIYGHESEYGKEWIAEAMYYPGLRVSIWFAQSDEHVAMAREECDEVVESKLLGSSAAYGISWRGNWTKAIMANTVHQSALAS